jgi:hypothetical protein
VDAGKDISDSRFDDPRMVQVKCKPSFYVAYKNLDASLERFLEMDGKEFYENMSDAGSGIVFISKLRSKDKLMFTYFHNGVGAMFAIDIRTKEELLWVLDRLGFRNFGQ